MVSQEDGRAGEGVMHKTGAAGGFCDAAVL